MLRDLAESLLQSLVETAIDRMASFLSGDREERVHGCGCFLVCCLLILLVVGVLVAANV